MARDSRIDVLLFDLGGVLVDFAGFEELSRMLPGRPDRARVRSRWIGSPSVQRYERGAISRQDFAAGVIRELDLPLAPDAFVAAFVAWARGPYPGATSLLRRLRGRYRIACLSNSNELHTPLHRRALEPLMDRCYFSDELGFVKPEREAYEHAVRDLGVPPQRIAFFDDTPVNVEAARRAGLAAYEVEGVARLTARLRELGIG
ncbi:MAG: HAD-IA family hydrolase [Solirubrobacteraceae bacterium]|nr:HAD-IA family hydrolase [Solirubrobacteraceae bacterium]